MADLPQGPDTTDRRILDLLRANARRPYGDIGARVGLSPSAVKRRIDRLEADGVIRGYTTIEDHAKLGRPVEAFTEIRFTGNARVDTIAAIADEMPEVEAVFTIAGDPDAVAWLRVRDMQDLKRVVDQIRANGHVAATKTLMVLGTSTRAQRQARPTPEPPTAGLSASR